MSKIKTLSPHVADMIAAGEVVERPGSVIKELVENSIDAGADTITIEIRGGGLTYMRVTDNGCGMSPEDAETAFLRHATSKLSGAQDLEAIKTLGFRGEALAATSAVSRMELVTKEKSAEVGTRLFLEAGIVKNRGEVGCPEGTTMIVRDLFFNTPARLKFMKTDKAEGSFITAMAMRCALSRPDISFKYIKDGKEEFHTPGDNRLDSCIYSLMGREFAMSLISAATDDGTVRVSGYVSAPKDAKGNRSSQFFFVNGRCVKSKLLQTALEQAYKNNLFTGRFPACVLFIEMSHGLVDVNVHPAKTEVKFLNERQVFDGVYYAALAALSGAGEAPAAEISPATKSAIIQSPIAQSQAVQPPKTEYAPFPKTQPKTGTGGFFKAEAKGNSDFFKKVSTDDNIKYSGFQSGQLPITPVKAKEQPMEPCEPKPIIPKQDYVFIGEAMNTYIIVQQGDSLLFIDKHAAHERMIFDRLKAGGSEIMSQTLLMPVICRLNGDTAETILNNMELLSPMGFEIDSFGEDSLAVRAVPADIDVSEIQGMIEELGEILSSTGSQGLDSSGDELLHSIACRAAIKAGKPTARLELEVLVKKVLAGEIKYCPHGRPVSISMTKQELDKKFKRI